VDVKICGLTNLKDAQVARDAGADYLGFVLYERSPRAVTPEMLDRIVAGLGDGVRAVGVFVNTPASEVAEIARTCGLYGVQIHGDEAPDPFVGFGCPVWRAMRIEGNVAIPSSSAWPASRYVIDAAVPGQYGGTGVTADWNVAAGIARDEAVMLAGGLTPLNVAEAIRSVAPLGVDVSSGVEAEPGHKDHEAVRAFVSAAKYTELNR
jgi:phosphoribosylanthranilate isomerase